MLKNADVTIYNKHFNSTTRADEYQRTYLYGVNWNSSKAVNVIKSGLVSADSAVIQIPVNVTADNGKAFASEKNWQAKTLQQISAFWTLQEGDTIVKGIVDYAIPPGTIAGLEKAYDDVLTITSVDVIDQGSRMLHHYRVGGK